VSQSSALSYRTELLIAGQLRSGDGDARQVINPSSGEVLAEVPDASLADTQTAIDAAASAWRIWAAVPELERADSLRRLGARLRAESERLASIIVDELGKPITEAEGEIGGTVGFVEHAASLLETQADEIRFTRNRREEIWTRRRPYGVVAAIVPWNFPSALVTRKLGPALAAGNAIVLKADEKTPLSALAIAEIVHSSGLFPDGLVNVLTGPGESVGQRLVSSPLTNLVTMTGSSEVGKAILAAAAQFVKPVHLELGGKAPFIVMPDANLDAAVADAVASRHLNNGQVCIANERTFVHESVFEDFLRRYVSTVEGLVVGDPHDRRTQIGPKVSEEELTKTLSIVDRSVAQGATLLTGGHRLTDGEFSRGTWIQPTVLSGVSDDMDVMQREVFGPVTPVTPFASWDEVVRRANASPYGLSAYIYTSDLATAMTASRDIEFGEVYINRVGPEEINGYHAGFRESGLGGDDGAHGLDGYSRNQTTYVRY
jgi:lactaldehyde dehydrogenase / glycolaldehyde dehydrogenase